MWAKIMLCFVLLFNLVGNNIALAAPSPPADKQPKKQGDKTTEKQTEPKKPQKPSPSLVDEIKGAKDRAVKAHQRAATAKIGAELAKENALAAKNAAIDAWTRMERAKSGTEESKEKANAEKKLTEAQTQAGIASNQAKLAKEAVAEAKKAKNETSTLWKTVYDDDDVDRMQDEASAAAIAAQKEARTASKAAAEAKKAVYDAQNVKKDKLGEEPYSDCGTWEVSCHMNAFLYTTAKWCLLGVYDMLTNVFHQNNIANNPVIIKLQTGFSGLSWTFLLLFLTYQSVRIMSLMILQEDYSDLKPLVRNTVIAAWLVSSLTWICNHLFVLGKYFTDFALEEIKTVQENINVLLMVAFVKPFSDYILVLLVVLAVICMIIIIQMAVRAAEFAFLVIIGPLVAVTIVNKEMNFFPRWWRSLLAVIFTQSVQALLFVTAFQLIASASLANFLVIIGFLVMTLRAPNMVNEWFQSSVGTPSGGSITNGAVGVVRGTIRGGVVGGGKALLRSLIKK